jgi:hypothetical protein
VLNLKSILKMIKKGWKKLKLRLINLDFTKEYS